MNTDTILALTLLVIFLIDVPLALWLGYSVRISIHLDWLKEIKTVIKTWFDRGR